MCLSSAEMSMQQMIPVTSSFVGCIQDMRINSEPVSFDRLSGVFGPVNLKECPGWTSASHCIIIKTNPGTMSTANHVQSVTKTENVFVCKNVYIMRSVFQCASVWDCMCNRDMSSSLQVHNICCSVILFCIYFVIKSCITAPFHKCIF